MASGGRFDGASAGRRSTWNQIAPKTMRRPECCDEGIESADDSGLAATSAGARRDGRASHLPERWRIDFVDASLPASDLSSTEGRPSPGGGQIRSSVGRAPVGGHGALLKACRDSRVDETSARIVRGRVVVRLRVVDLVTERWIAIEQVSRPQAQRRHLRDVVSDLPIPKRG